MSVFGKAKFGSNKRNWFKLKDGDNGPFRILPPMGDLQEDGRWSVFYRIHYGYKNSKGEMRTFQSPFLQNRKTKMVEVPDAALDRITKLKNELDQAKKAGNEDLTRHLLTFVGGKKSRFNLDSNHYMNVVDLQGNIGILKIRHRAKLALDAQIKKLRDSGTEPLDPETGRFFVFTRSGMGMETTYQVSVYKKRITVEGLGEVEQDVIHTITPEVAKRCLVENQDGSYTYKEAARLDNLFKRPTAEQVARIVKEGEKAVDDILDARPTATNANTSEDSGEDDSGLEGEEELSSTQTASGAALAAAAATAATVTAQAPVTATLTVTTPVAAPTPAPVVTAPVVTAPATTTSGAPQTTAEAVATMTDEEFLRSMGI